MVYRDDGGGPVAPRAIACDKRDSGVAPDASMEVIEAAGKAMQRKTHPGAGGNDTDFQEVQEAIREATQASDKSERANPQIPS